MCAAPFDPRGAGAPRRARRRRILVAGLGNELLTDDGVGIHVCRLLAPRVRAARLPAVLVAEVGTALLDACHLLGWADRLLAIDALQAGGAPGSIRLAAPSELERPAPRLGLHELELFGVLDMMAHEAAAAGRRAARPGSGAGRAQRPVAASELWLLGIEPATIAFGLELSAPVAAVVPEATDRAWSLLTQWLDEAVEG